MKNTTRKVAAKDAGAELQRLEENGLAVLTGPFVEAYVRVYGGTAEVKRAARQQFLAPLLAHVDEAGLGHVSEVADADAPYSPGGCHGGAGTPGAPRRAPCDDGPTRAGGLVRSQRVA